ncbi:HEPN domain-containing protein [Myceligenerans crystallogenes]|uniref:HEPN domain-containing protein n=1 Tax=Myceligenerans crystallogenes TaxID=316335 RepID=A0ABP4ZPX6_9MICO
MLRWEQGREHIDRMIKERHLQRVPASREQADFLLEQARLHASAARDLAMTDPALAYTALYDAARKSLVAVLANQGLRPTSSGGHIATHEAVAAQLVPPLGQVLRPFDLIRRTRNQNEYPDFDGPHAEKDDVLEDLPKAEKIIDMAARVLDQMPVY